MTIEAAFPNKVFNSDFSLVLTEQPTECLRLNNEPMCAMEEKNRANKTAVRFYRKIPWGGAALFVFMGLSVALLASITSLMTFLA